MKQILACIIVILAVASLATVGTLAHFSDTETSAGNVMETGSLDLQLGDTLPYPGGTWPYDDDEAYGADPLGDSVTRTWDRRLGYPGGMLPGDYLESRVYLRNVGSIEGTRLDIDCVNLNYDPLDNPTTEHKDAVMAIEYLTYYNAPQVDIVWIDIGGVQQWNTAYINDDDGDGRITLHDLELHGISGLLPPPLVGEACLDMKVVFDPPTDSTHPYYRADDYEGFKTVMTLIFTLQ